MCTYAYDRSDYPACNCTYIVQPLNYPSIPSATITLKISKQLTTPSRYRSRTHLNLITHSPDEDFRRLSRLRPLLALVPRITHTHSQLRPVAVERHRGNGGAVFRVLAQALFEFVVPDGDGPVGAC